MTEALIWMWAGNVVDNLSVVMAMGGILGGVYSAIAIGIAVDNQDAPLRAAARRWMAFCAVALVLACLTPPKLVFYGLAGNAAGKAALETEVGSKAYDAALAVIERIKREAEAK